MDLRLKFNEDEENYDKYRPSYVMELYQDIINYSGIRKDSEVLEIGIGTGQATLPFLEMGCNITAAELGDKLAFYSRSKFSAYRNIEIINVDFTGGNWDDNSYDLVYSATAFHWIPQELGYNMVMYYSPNYSISIRDIMLHCKQLLVLIPKKSYCSI